MSFDIASSLTAARARLGRSPQRRKRVDAGRSRLTAAARRLLDELLAAQEKPQMRQLLPQLEAACAREKTRAPSRAAVYGYLANASVPSYHVGELPEHVRALLYNLDDGADIPGP